MAIIDLTIASGRDESMDMIDGGFDQLIFWLTPGWIVDSQIPIRSRASARELREAMKLM